MKLSYIACLLLVMFASPTAFSQESVTGMLAPLGQVITVEGEIIDGSTTRMKEFEDVKLLTVACVDGQKLARPRMLRFHWQPLAQRQELSGKVTLIGYETGTFAGIPDKAFDHIPRVATTGFHFEHHFIVLKAK